MARAKSKNRELAFNSYKDKKGKITLKEIAENLNENINNIKSWKRIDNWDIAIGAKKRRGAPNGNINAKGNKGGGAPDGNLNAFRHGAYISMDKFESKKFLAKYLPKSTNSIREDIHKNEIEYLDMLGTMIELQFIAIIRSQKIMHVASKNDIEKEIKKISSGNINSEEYEIQFAWDRQERFMTSQSKAMLALQKMINSYDELLNKNWELATNEQKLRIEILKSKLSENDTDSIKIEFIKASTMDVNK